jgi:glutathione synthase/RimK-type ligase-like ATP-grasp enzyme
MTVVFIRQPNRAAELRNHFTTVKDDQINVRDTATILWRWGSRRSFSPSFTRQVNTLEACQLASNKPAVRRLCGQRGIRIPATYYTPDEARGYFSAVTNAAPLLWRPTSHYAGQNMVVVSSAAEVTQTGGYWSQIIAKEREFRVYVFFGRVVGVDEKIVEDRSQLAWNHSQGGRFEVLRWDSWPSAACWMSTRLAHAMNLHFGAFDLIRQGNHHFMLEVNTSPAMTSVYKINLLQRMVGWLDSEVTRLGNLPPIEAPLAEMVRGYRNYISPLHNVT